MPVPIYVVDAFTSKPYSGNPAGVCILEKAAEASWMRRVAAEMKHAETAFVSPRADGFDLRWFTPTIEVDLCGHATLASAHALWGSGRLNEEDEARFHTKSGLLTCSRHGYGIQMDFPAEPISTTRPAAAGLVLEALGLANQLQPVWSNRMDFLVEVDSMESLKRIRPDMARLAAIRGRGVIVTAQSDTVEFDFVSRFFAPAAGVPEDPVTGSAHCCLGPYWGMKLGKTDLIGFQCSERGGTVRVAVRGDRVLLQGHAVTVLKGEIVV